MSGVIRRLCGLSKKVAFRPVFRLKVFDPPRRPEGLELVFERILVHGTHYERRGAALRIENEFFTRLMKVERLKPLKKRINVSL